MYLAVVGGFEPWGKEAIHSLRYPRSALHGSVSPEVGADFGRPENMDASYRRLIDTVTFELEHQSSRGG